MMYELLAPKLFSKPMWRLLADIKLKCHGEPRDCSHLQLEKFFLDIDMQISRTTDFEKNREYAFQILDDVIHDQLRKVKLLQWHWETHERNKDNLTHEESFNCIRDCTFAIVQRWRREANRKSFKNRNKTLPALLALEGGGDADAEAEDEHGSPIDLDAAPARIRSSSRGRSRSNSRGSHSKRSKRRKREKAQSERGTGSRDPEAHHLSLVLGPTPAEDFTDQESFRPSLALEDHALARKAQVAAESMRIRRRECRGHLDLASRSATN